jgi:hypothetical protein
VPLAHGWGVARVMNCLWTWHSKHTCVRSGTKIHDEVDTRGPNQLHSISSMRNTLIDTLAFEFECSNVQFTTKAPEPDVCGLVTMPGCNLAATASRASRGTARLGIVLVAAQLRRSKPGKLIAFLRCNTAADILPAPCRTAVHSRREWPSCATQELRTGMETIVCCNLPACACQWYAHGARHREASPQPWCQ